jgi:lipopolysaccharide export LptBFGC system permease protein LptF
MAEFKPGLMAGLLSGLVWAGLMSVISLVSVELSYSSIFNHYNELYASNATALGGMNAAQYINYLLEFNTAITFILALAFGALIGFIFVFISSRFLGNRSYMVKGVAVALFFWLLYELGIGSADVLDLISSVIVSILAGYLLGFLYQRFTGSTRLGSLNQSDTFSRHPSS